MRSGGCQLFPCLRDKGLQGGQDILVVHLAAKFVSAVNAQVPEIQNECKWAIRGVK